MSRSVYEYTWRCIHIQCHIVLSNSPTLAHCSFHHIISCLLFIVNVPQCTSVYEVLLYVVAVSIGGEAVRRPC